MDNLTVSMNDKRLLSVKELCAYTGCGRNQAMAWGREIGAEVRFEGNRRVLYDRHVVDGAIDRILERNQKGAEV